MSARVHPVTDTVKVCTGRQDGAWMIISHKGTPAVSPEKLPEGTRVIIEDGRARRSS